MFYYDMEYVHNTINVIHSFDDHHCLEAFTLLQIFDQMPFSVKIPKLVITPLSHSP